MRSLLAYFLLLAAGFGAEGRETAHIAIASFVVTLPVNGVYAPWRNVQESLDHPTGEIIAIRKGTFNHRAWTDAETRDKAPLHSGKLALLKDRIFLDHPEVAYPYRVSGLADGVQVLLKWRGFEDWKKTGSLSPSDILYLQNLKPVEQN